MHNETSTNHKVKAVDLFCGCGGLSLGLSSGDIEIIQAIDNWDAAIKTYSNNFSHNSAIGEISTHTPILPADVIVGGPPCQGFSSAGSRRANDHRNSLVGVFADLIATAKPSGFLFENVEGFLTAEGGRFVIDLLDPLIEAGYHIHVRKVNVANYGVPQHRKRIIAIGGLGRPPVFPVATHAALGAPGAARLNRIGMPISPSVLDAIGNLPPATSQTSAATIPPQHSFIELNDSDLRRARLLKPGQKMKDLPEELWHPSYARRANRRVRDGIPTERRGGAPSGIRRLEGHLPSKAITSAAFREFVHPTEHRLLSLRECARLQSFPDDFEFAGNRNEVMLQIGNAVPPRFASVLSGALHQIATSERNTHSDGRLISFWPTNSSGMSPALRNVTDLVRRRYGYDFFQEVELCL